MTTPSRTFSEAFERFPDDEQARQEWLAGSDSYDGDGTENDNSNSDLALIEGDGIGGDNDIASNEAAAEEFSEEVATGEIDGHAPDSEVNAVVGTDGEPVAVAATEDEIEQSEATMYTTTEQDGEQTPQNPEQAVQQMQASYRQLLRRMQGQQTNDDGPSPALAVGSLAVLGIAGYWVLYE
ncbi:hypothetical protein [Haloarcula argentinensis]|uniref:Uncharacterized protein n=1 Tax=Haloarcula argentinensis TaxID=43776 RepID=A0A847UQA8_HALAR|nr:hypothetical protein [Haloarcula argentinensis]NLV14420.1 hypothetical protein [Haloarcula argentinensis]